MRRLQSIMYDSILNLSSEDGITASARNEVYGCVFGRDTAITVLKLLKIHELRPDPRIARMLKAGLMTLVKLQGRENNIESGEQPGKFIHEYRTEKYGHLISLEKPWFVYPDKHLRNYDSIDSTPLGLIAIYSLWEKAEDHDFLERMMPAVESGLNWIITYADLDGDGLVEYEIPAERRYGGLTIHSWTDSQESFLQPDGKLPKYPLAPVEVQAFAWLALKLWGEFYRDRLPGFAAILEEKAAFMRAQFNRNFILRDKGLYFGAQALDGNKCQIKTITANPLLCLWAAYKKDGIIQSIVDDRYIKEMVDRGFKEDLFDKEAGIRTMSSESAAYNPNQDSYHNGSFWPMLNGLIYEGLLNFGFRRHAAILKRAALKPIRYFGCPIELYIKGPSGYLEYRSPSGQTSCREQAWSAASILHMVLDSKTKTKS